MIVARPGHRAGEREPAVAAAQVEHDGAVRPKTADQSSGPGVRQPLDCRPGPLRLGQDHTRNRHAVLVLDLIPLSSFCFQNP